MIFNKLHWFVLGIVIAGSLVGSSIGQDIEEKTAAVLNRYEKALGGKKLLEKKRKLKIEFQTTSKAEKAVPKSKSTLFINGSKHVFEIRGKDRQWFLGPKQQPWNKGGQMSHKLPVHYCHPTAFPLFILNYPTKLKFDEIKSKGTDHHVLVASPIFPKREQMVDPSPKAFLFSRKTGLLSQVQFDYMVHEYKDYEKIQGLVVPQTFVVEFTDSSIVAGKFTRKITEFKSNYAMHESLFEPPSRKVPGKK